MTGFVFSETARKDMLALWEYIAQDDIDAADRVRDTIREAINNLVTLPGMGHRRDDVADETLRFWPVFSYLIVYRPQTDPLEIVRVISGYRDIAVLLIGH